MIEAAQKIKEENGQGEGGSKTETQQQEMVRSVQRC